MAHTITLHLLDAPGRLSRFQRKHPELAGRIPKKELAAYLNLTPETLSRLKQKLGPRNLSRLRSFATRPARSAARTAAAARASVMVPTSALEKKIAMSPCDTSIAWRNDALGAVAQHDREHQRRERVVSFLNT